MSGLFIGVTTLDLIYPIAHYPEEDSKTNVDQHDLFLGGPATNAAITFAALGGKATLISSVGNNEWSTMIKDRLRSLGVTHIDLVAGFDYQVACSSILVNIKSGLRTVVTSKPQNLPTDFHIPIIANEEYDVCGLDGFYPGVAIEIIDRGFSGPVVFDGGSYKRDTDKLLHRVTHPIFSERFSFPDGRDLDEEMSKICKKQYAITCGERPIRYFDKGISQFMAVPQVPAVDTLAAGDIFHGAFAWYILQHRGDFTKALRSSTAIAQQSIRFLGPRKWIIERNI